MRVPTAAASVLHHAHGHREPDTDELDCHGCARGEVDPVVPAAGARRRVRTLPPLVRAGDLNPTAAAAGAFQRAPPRAPRAGTGVLQPGRRRRGRAQERYTAVAFDSSRN
jgi:hypothetical protein